MQPSAFHLTRQGASHIRKNKECQDASLSFSNGEYAIAVVCDGHGGDDYVRSATGSSLACSIALKNIVSFLNDVDKEGLESHHDELIKTLEASIIAGWSVAIYDDYAQRPFTDAELSVLSEKAKKKYLDGKVDSAYGTTLIAVVLTSEFWFGIHIGDGKCVAVNREGKFGQPIPWDEKCFLNATTSLCDSNALGNFRHFFSYKLPAAIFIGSDGIDDCFNSNEQLYNLYRTVLYSFATSNFEMAKADLDDYLPRLSARGSGDDVSVAAVMDFDIIGELDIIKEYDREKEKARVEENARIEAEKAAEEKQRIEAEYAQRQKQREEAKRAEEERRRQKLPGFWQKFCENCGAPLHVGTKFCGACGTQVRVVLPPPLKAIFPLGEKNVDVTDPVIERGSSAEPEALTAKDNQRPEEEQPQQIMPETDPEHTGKPDTDVTDVDKSDTDTADADEPVADKTDEDMTGAEKIEEQEEEPVPPGQTGFENLESDMEEGDITGQDNNRDSEIAGVSTAADGE